MTREQMEHVAVLRHDSGMKTLATVADASAVTGIPLFTIYKWRSRHKIRAYGRLVDVGEVATLARELTCTPGESSRPSAAEQSSAV